MDDLFILWTEFQNCGASSVRFSYRQIKPKFSLAGTFKENLVLVIGILVIVRIEKFKLVQAECLRYA